MVTLAVDVGGSFTDLARWDGGSLQTRKVLTTPHQADGVVAGSQQLLLGRPAAAFLHGTTVATNAVLERKGAKVVLITSAGMEDLIEIGRQDRPSLYDPLADRSEPLVSRDRRLSLADGRAPGGLSLQDLPSAVVEAGPEAIAVCLLYGFSRSAQEEGIAQALGEALHRVPISLSAEVAPEFREFERTSTTVLNAYLGPLMGTYLQRLWERTSKEGLAEDVLVMRSSGGLMDARGAATLPVAALLSGPAGGAVAAAAIGEAHGWEELISFDMGGTSTDVCRIERGRPALRYERDVGGYPCRLPSVAIDTVGAGGGSIAWLDAGKALRVGPQSAGANPGPASYGRGGQDPTITDAQVVLGRIGRKSSLGGEIDIRPALATEALGPIGEALALTHAEVARGAVDVADTRMERAIRQVSTAEGSDPRAAWLVAFGGAGGLHASSLARRFAMPGVIVPPHAGVLSAIGLLLSPPRADKALSLESPQTAFPVIQRTASELAVDVKKQLAEMGSSAVTVRGTADARYVGQSHETAVPFHEDDDWKALVARFHAEHERRNGFSRPLDPVEVVTVRAEAVGKPPARWEDFAWVPENGDSRIGTRKLLDNQGNERAAVVHRRSRLRPGEKLPGPAVIEEPEATTFVSDGDQALVLEDGSLEISRG
ncbi:MAG: hydantoinase/oxoprolinase family protein [Acidimicrobiia bacterium]